MTLPGSDTLLTVDAFRQLHLAACTMHDLADGLDRFASEGKPNGLFKISRDLSRTGWNALYSAEIMRELAQLTQDYLEKESTLQLEDFFKQADALITSVNYLSKGIEALKCEAKRLETEQQSEAISTLHELKQRIKGVVHECKSL